MTLAEWGNPTASFSYCLKRLSTVEIRARCRLWVRAQAEPATGKKKATLPAGDARRVALRPIKPYMRTASVLSRDPADQ
jgi:hypothetical protein